MDGSNFDALTRTLTAPITRRVTLSGLAAGILVALGLALDESTVLAKRKNKGKGNNKKNNKKNKKKQCSFGRPRCGNKCCTLGESCRGNRCVHHCTDRQLNGGESDTDCGRVCAGIAGAGLCGLRKRCAGAEDCTSTKCQEPQPGAGLQCVECLIDSECTSPIFRRCLDNFCFECAVDADCPSPFGSPAERLCVVIDDCPRNQPCVCRQCRQDSDCLNPQRPHCDTGTDSISGKLCRECLQDSHCPAGQFCIEPVAGGCPPNQPCVCRECRTSADCPAGQICDETGNCVNQAGCTPVGNGCAPGITVCCGGGPCLNTTIGTRCRAANCLADGSPCELGNFESAEACCVGRCLSEAGEPAHCG